MRSAAARTSLARMAGSIPTSLPRGILVTPMPPRAALALALLLLFTACKRPTQAPGISQVVLATDDKSPRILRGVFPGEGGWRSEEHTSELQSLTNLVCRLLLEKKK